MSNSCPEIVPLASVAVFWLPPESRKYRKRLRRNRFDTVHGCDQSEHRPASHDAWATRRGAPEGGRNIPAKLAVGDIVGLTYGEEKYRFRVIWTDGAGTPEAAKVGLQSVIVALRGCKVVFQCSTHATNLFFLCS